MVFLGTPPAAVPALQALSRRAEVVLVITRGDRRRGRSSRKTPSEVGRAAVELGLPTACPEDRPALEDAIRSAVPFQLGVVVAYGMLLTRPMLDLAEVGFVNLHFSLLPRWRGAAPVAAAIRAGDPTTGVSLMKVTEGLDAGPVVCARRVRIADADTRGSLTEKLARLGVELLNEELAGLMRGETEATPQLHRSATFAPRLTSRDARIDFARPGEEVARQVRAMAPRPGAFAWWNQKRMRILGVRWSPDPPRPLGVGELAVMTGDLWCGVSGGALILDAIQPPGKRVMSGSAWANGVHGELGFLTAG